MSSRGLKIALAVSLVLNVFVVGAVAGAIGMRARLDPRRPPPAAMAGNPLMRGAEALPEDKRDAFRARLRAEGSASRPMLIESRRARAEAARLFAEPQFDAAAATAALAKARTSELAARERMDAVVVDFAKTLSVEERRELAKGLRGPGRGGRGERGERRQRPMGPPDGEERGPPPSL